MIARISIQLGTYLLGKVSIVTKLISSFSVYPKQTHNYYYYIFEI